MRTPTASVPTDNRHAPSREEMRRLERFDVMKVVSEHENEALKARDNASPAVTGAYHSIEISGGPTGHGVEILLDGKPLNGVRQLTVSMAAGDLTRVHVEFLPGRMHVKLPLLEEGKGIVLAEAQPESQQWAVIVKLPDGSRRLLTVVTPDGARGVRSEVSAAFGEFSEIEECVRA